MLAVCALFIYSDIVHPSFCTVAVCFTTAVCFSVVDSNTKDVAHKEDAQVLYVV